ncbi:MAG: type II toxin-antitoxin system PemK/MazF family toxin, partial [Ilumatobacteraceae bacterium]|nr:type II toxin-antitoxin system PemK/MazF family toxin [Ilumatobacteraceae bacterium]
MIEYELYDGPAHCSRRRRTPDGRRFADQPRPRGEPQRGRPHRTHRADRTHPSGRGRPPIGGRLRRSPAGRGRGCSRTAGSDAHDHCRAVVSRRAGTPLQGEVWWAEGLDQRRPVLVVTRSAVNPVLSTIVVAPVTRTIRDIPTELR